jgi:branched-chain amino acid transport system substrate-binding protein
MLRRRTVLGGTLLGGLAAASVGRAARAQNEPLLRVGVLTDLSGPYADVSGMGSVACVQQAAREAMAAAPGLKIEVVSADHQNKPDVGAGIAREWFDRGGVDAIVDVPNSAVALAVSGVAREKDRVLLASGAASAELTGAKCSPNTIHWTMDTYMLARVTGTALVAQGKTKWFFLVADYAFGHALERDATRFVQGAHGVVTGSASYPFPGTTDFSSYLVQAQASGAQVLALGNAGNDTVNTIKQAHEFGLTRDGAMTIAAMLTFITDIHSLGLETAQGLVLTTAFYWDLNDRTRGFAQRAGAWKADWRPNMEHAGGYSATLHYARVAQAMGVAEAKKSGVATIARMKATPTDDDAFGPGSIRADGRKLHPALLCQVKAPGESRGGWDLYKVLATVPPEDAFRPLSEGGCKLVAG